MEANGIANPVPIGLRDPWAVVAHTNGFAKLITEFWAPVTIRVHRCFLVAVHTDYHHGD